MENPLVSIVVTTRNEARNIALCLESAALQTYPNVELIVVDNSSEDGTKDIARGFTNLVYDRGPERSAQRNYGLTQIATGKYGMFLDADMIMTPQLVESCVNSMVDGNVVALHVEEIVLGRGILAAIRRFERSFYSGTVVDGVRFFDRKVFSSIGGFDENLPAGPEDWDLDKRFKTVGSVAMVPSVGGPTAWVLSDFVNGRGVTHAHEFVGIYHNEDEQSLNRYLSKKSYYSGSMSAYEQKWPDDPDVEKQLGFFYRFCRVFVESGRWRRIVKNPPLTLGMFFLRLLVGVVYLSQKNKDNFQRARTKKNKTPPIR